jgi:hypothetical protein
MEATRRGDGVDRPPHGLACQRGDRDAAELRRQQLGREGDGESGSDDAVDRERVVREEGESRLEAGGAARAYDQSVARRGEPRVVGEVGEADSLAARRGGWSIANVASIGSSSTSVRRVPPCSRRGSAPSWKQSARCVSQLIRAATLGSRANDPTLPYRPSRLTRLRALVRPRPASPTAAASTFPRCSVAPAESCSHASAQKLPDPGQRQGLRALDLRLTSDTIEARPRPGELPPRVRPS